MVKALHEVTGGLMPRSSHSGRRWSPDHGVVGWGAFNSESRAWAPSSGDLDRQHGRGIGFCVDVDKANSPEGACAAAVVAEITLAVSM